MQKVINKNHRLTSYGCKEVEYYSPPEIVDTARHVMRGIDLDPASCAEANEIVQAEMYFDEEDDGLTKQWTGKVWMNPPYTKKIIDKFIHKLCTDPIDQAIVLLNNNTETKWAQEILSVSNVICFPSRRVKFWNSKGKMLKGAMQGQMIIGIKVNTQLFFNYFESFGVCYFRN